MYGPIIAGLAFSILVNVLCFWRPNAGRVFLGLFFIAMGLGVNGSFVLTSPEAYLNYGDIALLPVYRWFVSEVVVLSPVVFGVLLAAFETTMGVLLLGKGTQVKIGLLGTMAFVIAIIPLGWAQIAWALIVIGQIHLLRQSFDSNVLELMRARGEAVAR